ncbi:MAG: 3'-5' exoribonuclease [Candidatus Marsarchaeota archaeon]|nr:3'-5' exoribonuclease [Candidatus Marsarchaeota archaeon]MCL5101891.1 3'-5' exoribonuclease [Candidatus Marsarchaeota archaeon]
MKPLEIIKEKIVILDIEGSGGIKGGDSYSTGSIVSLGAVDFNTGDEFYEECRVMDGRGHNFGALRVNGFTEEQIYDKNKQSAKELLEKFEKFCSVHGSRIIGAWGMYDLKMLEAAYAYYGKEWKLPKQYVDLKQISRELVSRHRPGLSNTAVKLGMPPEQEPHIGINGARLATEVVSAILFGRHYYKEYERLPLQKPKDMEKLGSLELRAIQPITGHAIESKNKG